MEIMSDQFINHTSSSMLQISINLWMKIYIMTKRKSISILCQEIPWIRAVSWLKIIRRRGMATASSTRQENSWRAEKGHSRNWSTKWDRCPTITLKTECTPKKATIENHQMKDRDISNSQSTTWKIIRNSQGSHLQSQRERFKAASTPTTWPEALKKTRYSSREISAQIKRAGGINLMENETRCQIYKTATKWAANSTLHIWTLRTNQSIWS